MDVVVVLEDVDVENEVVELEDELLDSATLLLMAALHWADEGDSVLAFSQTLPSYGFDCEKELGGWGLGAYCLGCRSLRLGSLLCRCWQRPHRRSSGCRMTCPLRFESP